MSAIMSHIRSSTFRRLRTVVTNQSPFSGKVYRAGLQDWRWRFRFEYAPMTRAQARPLLAELAALGEGTGSFKAHDPAQKTSSIPFAGTPGWVNGSGQTGTSLSTNNWPVSTAFAKAGDYVYFDDNFNYVMHRLLADASSDASGFCTLQLDAPLRRSPPSGSFIRLAPSDTVGITARLISYEVPTDVNDIYTITLEGEELI